MIKGAEGKTVCLETVLEMGPVWPLRSEVRPATQREISDAENNFELTGFCDHTLVFDESGFAYDIRQCAICGELCGLV